MSLDLSRANRGAGVEDHASRKLSGISAQRAQRLWERQALLTAAAHLFALHGFAGTTIRAVARAAGCREQAVRREFGGKAGLVASVLGARAHAEWVDRSLPVDGGSVSEQIVRMVEAEAARICCDRDTLRKVRHEPSAVAAQRAAQTSLTSSAQRIERRLRHFRQVTAGDRQVLLCAIQAVAYALSFDHAVEAWQAGAESKVRAFAGILAERIEGAGSAPSQSGMRLV